MFGMFNRKSVKEAKASLQSDSQKPTTQELHWNASVEKEDGYLALEWGKVRYEPTTDTVTMQYVVNNLNGSTEAIVKNGISIAESLAEIAKLRSRTNLRTWQYTENTWQSNLNNALKAVQVSGSISVNPAK